METTYAVRAEFRDGTHHTLTGLCFSGASIAAINTLTCIREGQAEYPSIPCEVSLIDTGVTPEKVVWTAEL